MSSGSELTFYFEVRYSLESEQQEIENLSAFLEEKTRIREVVQDFSHKRVNYLKHFIINKRHNSHFQLIDSRISWTNYE